VVIIYDNPQDIYRFPMTLNSTFTDNFHAHADYGSGLTLGRGGSITALVDGYGTLKTPAGTFINTLRVKLSQTINDTFYISGNYYSDDQTVTTSYNWIAQTHPGLTLMNISTGSSFAQTIDYAFYVDGTPTGIDEMANDKIQFSMFPNPTNGIIHLNFAEYLPNATLSLFDVTGREVYTKRVTDISETIHATEMSAGIYLLKVS
ncbi:MAG: T9SS type A sorting domain-containing protein, partial [Bacteroidota bacterium]